MPRDCAGGLRPLYWPAPSICPVGPQHSSTWKWKGPGGRGTAGQQRLFRCSFTQGEQYSAPQTRHLNRLARSCRQLAQSIPPLWFICEFAGASTGWAAPQWGGTMIPLRCPDSRLQEPLSQRVKPAGCPNGPRLCGIAGAALGTAAVALGSGQPAPPAGEVAKLRPASKRRLARTGGTMFCGAVV